MNCKICKGNEFICKSSKPLKSGDISRTRICKKCGYRFQTIEITKEEYKAFKTLLKDLRKTIERYTKTRFRGLRTFNLVVYM